MLKVFLLLGALITTGFEPSRAFALDLPYGQAGKAQASHTYEDKLYGSAWVLIEADGSATANAFFSNSRKLDGRKKVTLLVKVMVGESVLHAVRLSKSMPDPIFRGGTVERSTSAKFALTVEQWQSVTEIQFDFQRALSPAECAFFQQKAEENPNFYYNSGVFGCS
jgi:hypothetical protein